MLILSQDKEKVIKRLINFDNIIYLSVDKININYSVIIFKDSTIDDNKIKDYNCVLGVYSTEERAKEVLQEIFKVYRLNKMFECSDRIEQAQTLQAILKENMQPFTYEMPEK